MLFDWQPILCSRKWFRAISWCVISDLFAMDEEKLLRCMTSSIFSDRIHGSVQGPALWKINSSFESVYVTFSSESWSRVLFHLHMFQWHLILILLSKAIANPDLSLKQRNSESLCLVTSLTLNTFTVYRSALWSNSVPCAEMLVWFTCVSTATFDLGEFSTHFIVKL